MKAVVLDKTTEARDIILSECPIPDVRPGWVLVKVRCGPSPISTTSPI